MSDPITQTAPYRVPAFAPGALSGVRSRRIIAVLFDLLFVSIIVTGLWLVLVVATLGLALLFLPPLFPVVAFFYNGFTVSGVNMGTPGMRLMDLRATQASTGERLPFLNAAVHAVLFYVSWMFPPVFLWSLLAGDKRCLHDIFSDVMITRR